MPLRLVITNFQRHYQCVVCKCYRAYGDNSCWYGSYKQLEEQGINSLIFLCSEECKEQFSKQNEEATHADRL